MRVLVNATPLVRGGAIQVAAEFCHLLSAEADRQDAESSSIDWHLALSPEVKEAVASRSCEIVAPVTVISSPARDSQQRRELQSLEARLAPDCVYTIFGPAYVNFESPHVMGVADGWVTHANLSAFRCLKFPVGYLRTLAKITYKALNYRKADGWIVEAECAKTGLAKRLGIRPEQIAVVPNNCGSHYIGRDDRIGGKRDRDVLRVLTFASAYPHKQLTLIPGIANEFRARVPDQAIRFQLTIPQDSEIRIHVDRLARDLGVSDMIEHLGPIPVGQGPSLYEQADVSLLPTLLETFSATYPESMALGVPVVTTDLPFARDICGDAALYFSSTSPASACDALVRLIGDPSLRQLLIERGRCRQRQLPTSCERFGMIVDKIRQTAAVGKVSR